MKNRSLESASDLTSQSRVLHQIYDYYQNKSTNKEQAPSLERLFNREVSTTPTALLALLELMNDRTKGSTSDVSFIKSLLKEIEGSSDLIYSKLGAEIGPLLRKYQDLEIAKEDNLKSISQDLAPPSGIKKEILSCFGSHLQMSFAQQRVQLEILSERFPAETLDVIWNYLHNDSTDTGTFHKRWKFVIQENSLERGGKLSLYEFICRLLFIESPNKLAQFVKKSENVRKEINAPQTFSLQRSSKDLNSRAVACLPEPRLSRNRNGAAKAKVSLILASDVQDKDIKAMKEYLVSSLWEESLSLLETKGDDSDSHTILFQLLVNSFTENGVFPKYASRLLEVAPSRISMLDLLGVIKSGIQKTSASSSKTERVLYESGAHDISVASVRSVLLSKVNKGQLPNMLLYSVYSSE